MKIAILLLVLFTTSINVLIAQDVEPSKNKIGMTLSTNIYINNVKRASASNNTVAVPGYLVLINMYYQVN